jgi:hypothetical protein
MNVTVDYGFKTVPCTLSALSYMTIPNLKLTGCSNANVSVAYNILNNGSQLIIDYEYDFGKNLTGTHFIYPSEITWANTESPTGTVQQYNGSSSFIVDHLIENPASPSTAV